MSTKQRIARRTLVKGLALTPVIPWVHAASLTPSASEGPYYPTHSMRFLDVDNDLTTVEGQPSKAQGDYVRISGRVLNQKGQALENASVEIWQCDANGRYLHTGDRVGEPRDPGFQGFGRAKTNSDGIYSFRTIKPVVYPGRTPHIHVKVYFEGRERLTTQWYLADNPLNERDFLFARIPPNQRQGVLLRFDDAPDPMATLDLVI